jgi:hypothetical protein
LLFDDPLLGQHYVDFIKKSEAQKGYNPCLRIAYYCLALHNTKYGSDYGAELTFPDQSHGPNRLVDVLLERSRRLRAGVEFNDGSVLKHHLKQLVQDTTSPMSWARGVVRDPVIREVRSYESYFQDWEIYTQDFREQRERALADKVPFVPNHRLRPFPDPVEKRRERIVTDLVDAFLGSQYKKGMLHDVHTAVIKSQDAFDLLHAIELDIHYQLPLKVVAIMYEKLHGLLPASYQLHEVHAIALLLRGTEYDAEANRLWAKAQELRERWKDVVH